MTKQASTFPLRLSKSLRDAVTHIADEEGTSVNQFISMAVAEKISALKTAEYFLERSERADKTAFRNILYRKGGLPPQAGDEMPSE